MAGQLKKRLSTCEGLGTVRLVNVPDVGVALAAVAGEAVGEAVVVIVTVRIIGM